ncbi:MAG: 2-hydroxyacyl-CoA dehydratase [Candidatus Lokiarchaeota archaeon]|nr:2-hydroxyacyl-CoA dehydratase [Candidatus Lokiarchaeota archaeon]
MIDEFVDLFWKHRDRSDPRPVVAGYGHQFFPEELVAACGLDPVNLLVGGSEEWQTRGMDYLTPTSCVFSRQMIGLLEAARDGRHGLPPVKAMIHSNFCSGDWHSMEAIHRYFGVDALTIAVPYKATARALALLAGNLRRLAGELAALAGSGVDEGLLSRSIEQARRLQNAASRYARLPVAGDRKLRDYYEIALAPWEQRVEVANRLVETRGREAGGSGALPLNIVLTGSPVLVGDKFSSLLDALDVPVRFYDFHFADQLGLKRVPAGPGDLVALKRHVDFTDPFQVLAAYYLEVAAPERMVQGVVDHLNERVRAIVDYVRFLPDDQAIDGVVSHVLKFCDVYGTDRTPFKARVQDIHGIPVLDIERDYSASSTGQITTRIEAFKEMLVARKKHADVLE